MAFTRLSGDQAYRGTVTMTGNSTVARVEVEPDADGHLVAHWMIDGEPIAVDVAVGPTPDHIDHTRASTVPAGVVSLTLEGLGPERPFVSVAPAGGGPAVVATVRRVPFVGVTNFRDLGGYRTVSGGRTRWGVVFRADSLHALTDDDMAAYERLGVSVVYDLRGDAEREERPNRVESRPLPLLSRPVGAPLTTAATMTLEDGERVLHALYTGMLNHAAQAMGELLVGLTSPGGLPAVFHCHVGKDRTGVMAALLLEALGVDRATVLDDYELTSRYRMKQDDEVSYQRLVEGGMAPEAAAGIFTAPRWAMEEALTVLDADYGGIEAYLLGPAGLEVSQLEALRTLLVAPR